MPLGENRLPKSNGILMGRGRAAIRHLMAPTRRFSERETTSWKTCLTNRYVRVNDEQLAIVLTRLLGIARTRRRTRTDVHVRKHYNRLAFVTRRLRDQRDIT